ncbi:hypothetical protein [Paracoccus sp. Ld10]|uniref:hypothetical protein n=1 Tax=Paracoccus sp. Ld10 TaxID=649158 RepID=UPI00386530B5
MTQRNNGQNQDYKTKATAVQVAGKSKGLARWYWGTAGLLIVAALGVSAIAGRQDAQEGPEVQELSDDSGGWADATMRKAEQAAMEVMEDIDPALDAAFAPVYAGIPRYLDFHYSLKGEWLELSASVLGQMENQLDEQLFAGLEGRIGSISEGLQADFDRLWLASVETSLTENREAEAPFADLARQSVGDARNRIATTAVVFGSLGIGGAALAVVPGIVAKKLGPKIAGKVAVKTGARWATVASGAGAGGILCTWAGPAAAACVVVGGLISWVGVDYAIIKLDEHVSRDEFKQELEALVEEQKAAIRTVLQNIVRERLHSAQTERKDVVMTISLDELPGYKRRMACEAVEEIAPRYARVIVSLNERSPATVDALIDLLAQSEDSRLLAPWVDRVEASILDADLDVRLNGDLKIKVQVPQDLQNGREMRAVLQMGDLEITSVWTEPNSYGNFVFHMPVEDKLPLLGHQRMRVNLSQDGGLRQWNRQFVGQASFLPHSILPDRPGLAVIGETGVATWATGNSESAPRVWVEIPVSGARLEGVAPPEFCTI